MINLTIDGCRVTVPEGTTILEAARQANIDIPTLCYCKDLGCGVSNKPASCRICLVEAAGIRPRPVLVPACATPITNDRVEVWTNSQRALNARRTVLELMLSDHPKNCLTCPKNQDCELQKLAFDYGVDEDRFNELMNSLSTLGNVPYTYTYTENVTAQYYDVQARLKALQAQETRLLEMMELAETVEDIITIEDKLTDVRYRIDSFQSSLNNWDRRVAYSTLNITVKEVQVYTPETVTKITYGEELRRAFTDALKNAGQFFKDLLVFLVSALPTLVILAVLLLLFRPLLKKLQEKAKARREAKSAK